jgi:hypothetical protein
MRNHKDNDGAINYLIKTYTADCNLLFESNPLIPKEKNDFNSFKHK